MPPEVFLAGVLLVALVVYALTGGADFGGGVWDLFATGLRASRQRDALADAIAPIWEANHVWLILVIVLVFTAFPVAFAVIMTALNVPLMLLLVGIVLRGSAFVFRTYAARTEAHHRRWGAVFGASSMLTPFLLGVCLGALGSGDIRAPDGRLASGFFAGWTQPFAIGCGVFAQALFAFLAATYMTVETVHERELSDDFRARALVSGVALAPIALAVFLLAREGAPGIFAGLTRWWAPFLLVATSICAVAALVALYYRDYRTARIAAAMQVALILCGWGLAQYPHLVVPDITFAGAAAPERTLRLIMIALVAGAIVLVPSFAYLFRVFKRTPFRSDSETH
jgi:cytochrome d ubiquinol oxidase subunit II